MITLQRLTEDSSWFLHWSGIRIVIDPWLIGSEIDGFSWLNQQWHSTEPMSMEELPEYDLIMVSQSYEDHCHTPTLKVMDSQKPIYATTKAYKKLKKSLPGRKLHEITPEGISVGQLTAYSFVPDKLLDPIYYGVLLINSQNEGIFYCPHGFSLNAQQIARFEGINVKLLITTFTEFDLPALLGGKVNPGMNNVYEIKKQINPKSIVNTHDEEKIMKGLVARSAKVKYADYKALSTSDLNFQYIKGYDPVEL